MSALVSEMPRRNGWTIAQCAGDRTQRLLNRAAWDTFAAMSQVRRFAAAGLDEAARRDRRRGGMVIGAIDETGQEKAGEATAGVKSAPPERAPRASRWYAWAWIGTASPRASPARSAAT